MSHHLRILIVIFSYSNNLQFLNDAGQVYIQQRAPISLLATTLTVAAPVAVYLLAIYALYYWLLPYIDRFHGLLLAGTALVLLAAIAMSAAGFSLTACLAVLVLAPAVGVFGYEAKGYRHNQEAIARLLR